MAHIYFYNRKTTPKNDPFFSKRILNEAAIQLSFISTQASFSWFMYLPHVTEWLAARIYIYTNIHTVHKFIIGNFSKWWNMREKCGVSYTFCSG